MKLTDRLKKYAYDMTADFLSKQEEQQLQEYISEGNARALNYKSNQPLRNGETLLTELIKTTQDNYIEKSNSYKSFEEAHKLSFAVIRDVSEIASRYKNEKEYRIVANLSSDELLKKLRVPENDRPAHVISLLMVEETKNGRDELNEAGDGPCRKLLSDMMQNKKDVTANIKGQTPDYLIKNLEGYNTWYQPDIDRIDSVLNSADYFNGYLKQGITLQEFSEALDSPQFCKDFPWLTTWKPSGTVLLDTFDPGWKGRLTITEDPEAETKPPEDDTTDNDDFVLEKFIPYPGQSARSDRDREWERVMEEEKEREKKKAIELAKELEERKQKFMDSFNFHKLMQKSHEPDLSPKRSRGRDRGFDMER